MGQGASMALPIVGKFTNKCYADPSLGYDRSMQFDLDQDFMDNMKNSCSEYSAFDVENTEYEVAEEE